jgi:catechol 2,3-dioxygenase-like lactoylglutathione lyase family enzyme
MASPLGNEVAQVAIVVHDLDASVARYEALLGMKVSFIVETEPGESVNQSLRGEPSHGQARLAFFNMKNIQIELIQPLGGNTVWQQALDERGEHVQHLAFWVEGMDRCVDFLAPQGITVSQRGDMGQGQYVYFDSAAKIGVDLELLEAQRT